jgi:hypothetical protein
MVLVHMSRIPPSDHHGAMMGGGAIHAVTHGGGLREYGVNVASAAGKASAQELSRQAWGVLTGRTNARGAALKVINAGGHAAVDAMTGGVVKRGGADQGGRVKRARLM